MDQFWVKDIPWTNMNNQIIIGEGEEREGGGGDMRPVARLIQSDMESREGTLAPGKRRGEVVDYRRHPHPHKKSTQK